MTKLFITGATGYIGGDALYVVANAYPDLEITALVRNSDKGGKVAAQFAKIRLAYGDLDSSELLTKEAAQADIVLHCADADHVGAAKALVAGLAQRQTPSYLIHTSGTGILSFADFERKTYGVKNEKVFDDWDGIDEVVSLPDTAVHRDVDKIILGASGSSSNVFSAIVCPPCIYGSGRGCDNKKSVQVYRMARATIHRGKGFAVEEGNNTWTQVHVQDLSNIYLALVTAALSPSGGKATWNSKGYYFAEGGDLVWGDVARAISKIAHEKKLIVTAEIDQVSPSEADKLTLSGSYLWGMNSRCKAIRANKLFGWTPKQKNVFDLLPEIVEGEAKELGAIKGHAAKAAGDC
ncbi:NAD dependent epimerase/dehydratase family protein [Dothidotthia symphoricarpi CBS 119687]|uniref:NAD dependent epimerase/dehydratase family protein n=1 Tax=Dothidotthia symphoricarpi CBS 119687 TaxID=1392245 RepID=A0A6A6A9N1_9PLEO|nr:NAD dependent epimerase/dehydratase family protein [Dothidotthia symphoricarpi CBS 119687]KAF2128672.1 NAD dependent epimerase/dehydratase family protein [Dothidotthia symphoricarpi CBS 119687]